MTASITKGLIIRLDPLNEILHGKKTWEMRTTATQQRGPIALIGKGSKAVFGIADLVDCKGPLSRQDIAANVDRHGIKAERQNDPEVLPYNHAWVLANVRVLPRPVDYIHKSGSVIWATLDPDAVRNIESQLHR